MQAQSMQVLTSQATEEWYTPATMISMIRDFLGGIDLDPASDAMPQQWIQAAHYYTKETDGMAHEWYGKVYLNPPYNGNTAKWLNKLHSEYVEGNVLEAIALVNSAPGYRWFESLWRQVPVCMLQDRMRFVASTGIVDGQAKKGQCLAYYGTRVQDFQQYFSPLGLVIVPELVRG